jgi:hypothetical protein
MTDALIKGDLCWGCEERKYVGEGQYECGHEGGVCQSAVDLEWIGGVIAGTAKLIADHGGASRDYRVMCSGSVADAFQDMLWDMHVQLNMDEFYRRCDTPTLKES